jgi:tetratricopeptide (TPR) repeat protein
MQTADVVRKELKIEPSEFDRRFLEFVEAGTRTEATQLDDWKTGVKVLVEKAAAKDWDTVISVGPGLRDKYPDYVEEHNVYEMLAEAYTAKGNKAAAIAELLRYEKVGGRNPETLKLLAKQLEEAGRGKEAADALNRLNFIYPMDEAAHRSLGTLWLVQNNPKGAVREFQAVLAKNPMDQAQSHFDLARAYQADHKPAQAKDECLAALEAAPGFRPAQKLLLELSNSPEPAAPPPVKK